MRRPAVAAIAGLSVLGRPRGPRIVDAPDVRRDRRTARRPALQAGHRGARRRLRLRTGVDARRGRQRRLAHGLRSTRSPPRSRRPTAFAETSVSLAGQTSPSSPPRTSYDAADGRPRQAIKDLRSTVIPALPRGHRRQGVRDAATRPARSTSPNSSPDSAPWVALIVLGASLRAAPRDVQVGDDRGHRHRAQCAVDGRRVRSARGGLPVRLGRGPARHAARRRHRAVDPAVPLRGAVRPVDGLPRVPA